MLLPPRTAEVPMNFAALVEVLLADYYRLQPADATGLGFHEHDDRWPDLTDAGRADWSARLARAAGRPGPAPGPPRGQAGEPLPRREDRRADARGRGSRRVGRVRGRRCGRSRAARRGPSRGRGRHFGA